MKMKLALAAAAAAAFLSTAPATAQRQGGAAIISIYHAAPGEQVALLKWMAAQDRVAAAAGVAPNQLYVHSDGADWDYLVVAPVTTPAQDAAIEAAGKRLGIDAGPRSAIEFRRHISGHTDTFVRGPTSAAGYLAAIGER